MRFKFALTGVFALSALIAGLFATAVAALVGTLALTARRVLSDLLLQQRRTRTMRNRVDPDVIDVTATEVPPEPRERIAG
jgi:hypothetical protein